MTLRHLARLAILQVLHAYLPYVGAAQYGENHSPVEKDEDLVAAHFPDTDDVLLSPAFLAPQSIPDGFRNGTDGPTDDVTLDNFLRSISDRNDWVDYRVAEVVSEEGRSFPYVYLSENPRGPGDESNRKLRVWIQGGVHGNEPAGDQAVLALLGKLDANRTWTASLLQRIDIILFPRSNPDGVSYFQRALASNLDPNREHTKLARLQSRGIKRLLSSFAPHIVVDMHEFTGTRLTGGRYKHGMDALIAPGKNLNTHQDIRNISETLFAAGIGKRLDAAGFRWEPYFTAGSSEGRGITLVEAGSDAKAGRNNYGLMQSIVILNEVRGIRLADQHFQRRVSTALTMVSAILDIALENFDDVYSTVENAINKFIASDDDIVVTDYQNPISRSISFVDVANGSLVQVPVNWLSTTPTTANLTRARPEAYLIPRTWSDLAIRLKDSGVIVETLDYEYRGTVEALRITSASPARAYYEGAIQVTVTTEPYQKEVRLPVGSFRISTRQKNAALAFVTLEPENIDSYVRFNLVPVQTGDEYPIFRVPSGPKRRSRPDEL
ncbi:putative carboxypeptidase 2 [Rosellinia necatrix]|uniref:Carboxypeptidase M14B n=1 Tax=Rosellinia necatrix TaxID=77044 RepID=A0A1S7UMT1_ROSNE|nr:putative carboxypeptidase 2 [Rosellinia necatrix]